MSKLKYFTVVLTSIPEMKVAKIINTTFAPRSVRMETNLCGNPLGWFSHSQNFTKGTDIIDLIGFTLDIESKTNPGCETDLVFVNNQIGWAEGDDFLDGLNGNKLPYGQIRVIHRENIGLSYGSFNHAFSLLQDEYQYFLFTEDDVIITGKNYSKLGIEAFNSHQNCGFVGYIGINTAYGSYSFDDAYHIHGATGLTTSSVLKHVIRENGSLAHSSSPLQQDRPTIVESEIAFTNQIYKLGYNLVEIDRRVKLYEHTFDLMRGIKKPRYASISDRALFHTKRILAKFPLVLQASRNYKAFINKYRGFLNWRH